MKKYIFLVTVLAGLQQLSAQIVGETDVVSQPKNLTITHPRASTSSSECPNNQSYNCGWEEGYQFGKERGLYDASTCNNQKYLYAWFGDPTIYSWNFIDGHYDGYQWGYDDGYNERIAEKANSCQAPFYFDDVICGCRCDNKEYWYDHDGDNYYNPARFTNACQPPTTKWKLEADFAGKDCNDNDPNTWHYNACGQCSAEPGLSIWYFDGDGDGYHSRTINSCSKPGPNYSLTRSELDCDDNDSLANVSKQWYYFGDADNYYGTTRISCKRPTEGIASKWKVTAGSGVDCDDTNPDIIGVVTRYYNYDGDDYYGIKETSCFVNESWEEGRWSTDSGSGPDCDDYDENVSLKDVCGVCGGDGTPTQIYWDFDQDGYYSIAWEEYCDGYEIGSKIVALPLSLFEDLGIPASAWDWASAQSGTNAQTISCPTYVPGVGVETRTHEILGGITNRVPIGAPYDYYLRYRFSGYTIQYYYQADPTHLIFIVGIDGSGVSGLFGTDKNLGIDCNDFDPDQWSYGDWYADRDRDGYHDPDVDPIPNTCRPADDGYVLLANSLGEDCDDTDKWANGERIWYYSFDEDEYYSTTTISCENPAKGTDDESKWQTDRGEGEDCDDTDPDATEEKHWYLDRDGDGRYIENLFQCSNPGKHTEDELFWKVDADLGVDCDDSTEELFRLNACGQCIGESDPPVEYYIDLDGDGYHSVVKEEDCGLPTFSETLLETFDIYASIKVDTEGAATITIPSTGEIITYHFSASEYSFPVEVLTFETLGLDCNDLDPAVKAEGSWYADLDEDGYHDAGDPPVVGCTPPSDYYVLLENSLGEDCDDDARLYNVMREWYKDTDGDGYFVDYVQSCYPPGYGWTLTSNAGLDDDDTNPFTPAYGSDDFIIPSLIQTVTINNLTYVEYLGERYELDQFSILYRGVELRFEDIIFDRVSAPNQLIANTLLSGREAAIYDAEIITTVNGVSAALPLQDPTDPELKRGKTQWITETLNQAPEGYSATWGDVSFGRVGDPNFNEEALAYFDEFFDPAKFNAFKAHYATYGGPPFTLKIQAVEGTLLSDTDEEVLNEKMGDKEQADVIFSVKKFPDKHVEFVVFIRDDEFKATVEELKAPKGIDENGDEVRWVDDAGNWINPEDEQVYLNQLGLIQGFRQLILPVLSVDYENITESYDSPEVPAGIPQETYPTYNLDWGILSKWAEVLEINHHHVHHFQMPEGIWNNTDGVSLPAGQHPLQANSTTSLLGKWRTRIAASVAGIIDMSSSYVANIFDATTLAMSQTFSRTWEQVMGSTRDFNIGQEMAGMTSAFHEIYPDLDGSQGSSRQIYATGKAAGLILKVLDRSNALPSSPLIVEQGSPVNSLAQQYNDFDLFENSLNHKFCFQRAWLKGNEIFNKYGNDWVLAFSLELLLCETEKENCGTGSDIAAFSCGVSNALLQEVNWLTLAELDSQVAIDFYNCVKGQFSIRVRLDNEVLLRTMWTCILGGSPEEFASDMYQFATENWDDAYTQGQATVFAVTLLSPFKARILSKVDEVTGFDAKVRKFEELAMARHRDELAAISRLSSKLDNSAFALLRDQVDALDLTSRTRFFRDFSNASDDILIRLQVGELNSWRALDNIGVDDAIRKNTDYLKNIDEYAKRSGKSADEVADLAKNNENGIEQFLDELEDTPASGHWDKNPFQRGRDIEDDLGQNLPETFKTIDKYNDVTGEVTSIKSLDLDAKTYQTISKLKSRLNKYVKELEDFDGYELQGVQIGDIENPINSKSLELAIPRAATGEQLAAINEVTTYAASKGIDFKVKVFP